ncbi:orotate phosphoribosyltransferase [Peptococcaceae bacterium SCADC1_2_3]|nr:orotate phosphoribosyltransferase [Peptococcaceae bacterium SCADC1_2_3]KFI34816.1 orotate phosphoribosyltransferase [Peptococcaceae bacterium SCADC1_2_3]
MLYELVKERSFKFGEFILSSGKKSNYYFDGKQVTLHPLGAYTLAKVIIENIKDENIQAIGGPTIGADPIVGSLAPVCYLEGLNLKLFIVRKTAKEHGGKRLIEGPKLLPSDRVAILDDVLTTGSSIIKAIEAVKDVGCPVVKIIVLVDRLEGGTEKIESMGLKVDSIFTMRDFDL